MARVVNGDIRLNLLVAGKNNGVNKWRKQY